MTLQISSFSIIFFFFLRERERERERARVGEGEREREKKNSKQAPYPVEADTGLDPTTVRPWTEPKSRVACLTDWATQAPLSIILRPNLKNYLTVWQLFHFQQFINRGKREKDRLVSRCFHYLHHILPSYSTDPANVDPISEVLSMTLKKYR